jgi:hypothetical protein
MTFVTTSGARTAALETPSAVGQVEDVQGVGKGCR